MLRLFGGADRSVPPVRSLALLRTTKAARDKDWTIVVYPVRSTAFWIRRRPTRGASLAAEAWVRRHVEGTS